MIVRYITRRIYTNSMSLRGDSLSNVPSPQTGFLLQENEWASHLRDGVAAPVNQTSHLPLED
jgi:hypothetical protein